MNLITRSYERRGRFRHVFHWAYRHGLKTIGRFMPWVRRD